VRTWAIPELRREGRQDWTSCGDTSKRMDHCWSTAWVQMHVLVYLGGELRDNMGQGVRWFICSNGMVKGGVLAKFPEECEQAGGG
jgi:predicted oxidoreductase